MAGPETVTAEAKRPKGKKILESMRVTRGLSGGHTITHHYEGYQHDPKPYHFAEGEGDRALAHIARHAGLPTAGKTAQAEPMEPEE